MITVTPIQDKSLQAHFCGMCGIPYKEDLLAYAAYNDKKEFVGICQFGLDQIGVDAYECVMGCHFGSLAEGGDAFHMTSQDLPPVNLGIGELSECAGDPG